MGALLAWTDDTHACMPNGTSGAASGTEVVEMALRSLAPLRERRFTAWRGRSGKRYVASVFAAGDETALGFADAVLIAVTAGREVLAVRDSGPFGIGAAMARWRAAVVMAGAEEIHVHLLAETLESRRAVVADLTVVVTA